MARNQPVFGIRRKGNDSLYEIGSGGVTQAGVTAYDISAQRKTRKWPVAK